MPRCQRRRLLRTLLSPTLCGNVPMLIKWSRDGISNLSSPDTSDVWRCRETSPPPCERSGRIKVSACLGAASWTGRQAGELNP